VEEHQGLERVLCGGAEAGTGGWASMKVCTGKAESTCAEQDMDQTFLCSDLLTRITS
jgi:hypothetical protein